MDLDDIDYNVIDFLAMSSPAVGSIWTSIWDNVKVSFSKGSIDSSVGDRGFQLLLSAELIGNNKVHPEILRFTLFKIPI